MANQSIKTSEISVLWRTARITLVVFLVLLSLWLVHELRVLVVDVLLAVIIATAINPAANYLNKYRVPRIITVLLCYGLIVLVYFLIGLLLRGPIQEQSRLFMEHLPRYLDGATAAYNSILDAAGDKLALQMNPNELKVMGQQMLQKTLNLSFGVLGVVLNIVLILFLAAYFAAESKNIVDSLVRWVPPSKRARVDELLGPVGMRMGGYLRGQLLVASAVATFFAIGYTLIGLPYAIVLGLVAGVLNLIPFVGSTIATVLAVAIAINQSWTLAGLVLVVFAIEQVIESNLLVPHLLGKQVDLDPLVVLFAVLIGASLGGGVGALVAVPLTAAGMFLVEELYIKPMEKTNT